MNIDALIQSFGGTAGAMAAWHALPAGVKLRVAQGYDRLAGRVTRKWDVADLKEKAGLADEDKRASNQTDVQRAVLQQLVPEIAKEISGDPDLLKRAMIQTMGEAYRKQVDKDAVVEECLKDIANKSKDHSETSQPLDEDWLNMFSSHAEKATSEHARHLFGRILSGQVRHPGRFSLSTIRCLSEVDQRVAKLFSDISPLISRGVIFMSAEDKNKRFSDFLDLQEAGLVAGVESGLSSPVSISEDNFGEWYDEHLYLKVQANSRDPVQVPCIVLTKAGRELLTLVDRRGTHGDRLNVMYDAIPRHAIKSFSIHLIIGRSENGLHYQITPLRKWPEEESIP